MLSLGFDLPKYFINVKIIMKEIHYFYDVNIFIKFFRHLPLDYYLSTDCGKPSFVLAYLCKRYFWDLIIIFVGCNPNLKQN